MKNDNDPKLLARAVRAYRRHANLNGWSDRAAEIASYEIRVPDDTTYTRKYITLLDADGRDVHTMRLTGLVTEYPQFKLVPVAQKVAAKTTAKAPQSWTDQPELDLARTVAIVRAEVAALPKHMRPSLAKALVSHFANLTYAERAHLLVSPKHKYVPMDVAALLLGRSDVSRYLAPLLKRGGRSYYDISHVVALRADLDAKLNAGIVEWLQSPLRINESRFERI